MKFNFDKEESYLGQIEIEDIGNCAIRATDIVHCLDYYLVIKTNMGISSVFQAGPFVTDQDTLDNSCGMSFQKYDYSEYKLEKTIKNFLNMPKVNIEQAEVISSNEALDSCIDLAAYMKRAWR